MQSALKSGDEGGGDALVSIGKMLSTTKGCIACHSTDGSRLVGPSFRGVYGLMEVVTRDGAEHEITIDEDYLRRSIRQPNAEIVGSFAKIVAQLRVDAVNQNWHGDWTQFNDHDERAAAATESADYRGALREHCRAVSFMMGQLVNRSATEPRGG